MTTEIKYPAGTTKEEWEKYYADLKKHEEACDLLKPQRNNYLTQQAFEIDFNEWYKISSMDAPNKPGYYRAAND